VALHHFVQQHINKTNKTEQDTNKETKETRKETKKETNKETKKQTNQQTITVTHCRHGDQTNMRDKRNGQVEKLKTEKDSGR